MRHIKAFLSLSLSVTFFVLTIHLFNLSGCFLSARSVPPSVCSQHIDRQCLCLSSSYLLILS